MHRLFGEIMQIGNITNSFTKEGNDYFLSVEKGIGLE